MIVAVAPAATPSFIEALGPVTTLRAEEAARRVAGRSSDWDRGIVESTLPRLKTLNVFFALTRILVPDMILSRTMRGGPATFPHSYRRYRDFSRELRLVDKLDAIVRTDDPDRVLRAVFGRYSKKPAWPFD